MHGETDKITFSRASREFVNKLIDSKQCTSKMWDDFYHEIHNEPEKDKVFKFLSDWFNEKVLE